MRDLTVKLLTVGVVLVGIFVVLMPQDASACVPAYQEWGCNDSERVARSKCSGDSRGAIWFGRTGSDYFADEVNVSYNETSVPVVIRGSVFPCGTWQGWNPVYAVNIRPEGPNGWRLKDLSSTTLWRGNFQGMINWWTTPGGSISATLDLSGIPVNTSNSPVTHKLMIDIYRCYSKDGRGATGACYADPITVTIVRAGQPIQWRISAKTEINANYNNDRRGTTIGFRHELYNNGPSAINRDIVYQSRIVRVAGTKSQDPLKGDLSRIYDSPVIKTGPQPGYRSDYKCSGNSYDYWCARASNNKDITNITNGGLKNSRLKDWDSTTEARYVIEDKDAGSWICSFLNFWPLNQDQTNWNVPWNHSTPVCRYISPEYYLTPSITVPATNAVIFDSTRPIPVTGVVENKDTNNTKSHTNIEWRITQLEYPATLKDPANKDGGFSSADACGFFTGSTRCTELHSGTESNGYLRNETKTYNTSGQHAADSSTKVCFAVSVRRNASDGHPQSSNPSGWRHSAIRCLTYGKQPKVSIYGGDVQTGRSFDGTGNANAKIRGSITSLDFNGSSAIFGSYSEYGLFSRASGGITGMASRAGLNKEIHQDDASQAKWSYLSFNRRPGVGGGMATPSYGGYSYGSNQLPDISTAFSSASAPAVSGDISVESLRDRAGSPGGTVTASGNLKITGGTLSKGRWVVINAQNSNIVISGNITYEDTGLTSAADIPQLVIIGRNITINSDVDRVDAWLIAKPGQLNNVSTGGAISTCDQNGTAPALAAIPSENVYKLDARYQLSDKLCDKQLTINGPIIAKQLFLRRTHGSFNPSGPGDWEAPGVPAEIINFRPDAYLWAQRYVNTRNAGQYRTAQLKEIPPRY